MNAATGAWGSVPSITPANRNIRTVGLLVESSRGSGRDLLSGVGRFVRSHPEWSVYWEPSGFETPGPIVKHVHLDGLIVRDVAFTDEIRKLPIPKVVFGHLNEELPGVLNVSTDSQTVGRIAAEHLLACGFRHFAYLGVFSGALQAVPVWSKTRQEAFAARIQEAGFQCATFKDAHSKSQGWQTPEAIAKWLLSLPKPVGCMAANDDRAHQAALACKLAGLSVPEQVGIIGVDNDELLCGFCDPELSSVAMSFERAGFSAAMALDGWMRSGKPPLSGSIVVPASFVAARRSTDVVAVEDENLAKALRYINLRLRQGPIQVSEIARVAGLSRRTLERRFQLGIGRSIQDHIRRLRIAEITQAVVETDLPIVKIARSLGFEDLQHFSRYFRASQGMSPLAYRRSHQSGRTQVPERKH